MKLGNSKYGRRISYTLMGIFAYAFSVSGVSVAIDAIITWTGLLKRVFDSYQIYIVENINKIIEYILYPVLFIFDFDIPDWISLYASICISITGLHYSVYKLYYINKKEGKNLVIDSINLLNPYKNFSNKFKEIYNGDVKFLKGRNLFKKSILIIMTLSLIAIISVFTSIFLVFAYPYFIFRSSLNAFKIYTNYNFDREILNEEEDEIHRDIMSEYNVTITFWSAFILIILTVGMIIKFNDELHDRCDKDQPSEISLICGYFPK